jgi:hypothetical protein
MQAPDKKPAFVQTSFLEPEVNDYADRDRRAANASRYGSNRESPSTVNGPGYIAEFDAERLKGQLRDIFQLMKDSKFRTLSEIEEHLGRGSQTGISAALRSLRKKEYGKHTVNKRRRGDPKRGLFEYQLSLRKQS